MDELTHLLIEAADGDRQALNAFVAGSQADVWRFCASLVGPAAADDAVQETFLRAWRSARTFRAEASAKTWLLAIARRVSYAALKQQARHTAVPDDGSTQPVGDAGELVALHDLVGRLERDRRTAFVLTQLLGLGYAEAAEVCGCPIGTIRSRVARARADLIAAGRAEGADGGHRASGPPSA